MSLQKQQTIRSSFELEGKGLHTGLQIHIKFLPADNDHGITITRVDLPNNPTIPAFAEYVGRTQRSTVLRNEAMQISTIEHAMAALYAMGIDNCRIEVNAPEFPILNGSAQPYVDAINSVGIVEQEHFRELYIVKHKIEYKDPTTGSHIILLPDDDFRVNVLISFDSVILGNQYASMEDLSEFASEFASSRTFVFVKEIQKLLEADLIKGGDLDNAIVIYDEELDQSQMNKLAEAVGVPPIEVSKLGYINHKPLMYNNEPARHKLLDLIGDLALIGRRIKGRVIATCPGHSSNTALAKLIRKEIKLNESQAPVYNPNLPAIYDIQALKRLLPHRYPMLLVDKIIELAPTYIVGVKNYTANEPFFQGHFPSEPVLPGVLMVESIAQIGGVLILSQLDNQLGYSTYFLKIDNAKFRQKVVPGDTVIYKVSLVTPLRRGVATMRGLAFVGERLVCEAEFMAQVVKNPTEE